jgi:hypothetical protein
LKQSTTTTAETVHHHSETVHHHRLFLFSAFSSKIFRPYVGFETGLNQSFFISTCFLIWIGILKAPSVTHFSFCVAFFLSVNLNA